MTALRFRAVAEHRPGPKLAGIFRRHWPAYRRWYLSEGDAARPDFATCARMLRRHMPELLPAWEALVEAVGGGDQAARFLSLWQPPGRVGGCSQAIWVQEPRALVRNYDYPPALLDGLLLRTSLTGAPVLAMSDCLWGVLDGLNGHGLAISLAFGGRQVSGVGFGIAIVLRYILETCLDTAEAVAVLRRVPVHMPYNLALVDRHGGWRSVAIAPDRPLVELPEPVSANRQGAHAWPDDARLADSVRGESILLSCLDNPALTLDRLVARFLQPPVFRPLQPAGWGTLYTACWQPGSGSVDLYWPGQSWHQALARFDEGERIVTYATAS